MHVFGPGVLHAPSKMIEFQDSTNPERRLRVPPRQVKLVCLYGPVRVTSAAVSLLNQAGAAVAYLDSHACRCHGVIQPARGEARLVRYRQYHAVQTPEWCQSQAAGLIQEKIDAMLEFSSSLQRQSRIPGAKQTLSRLRLARHQTERATSLAGLRGIEGNASKLWFQLLAGLLPDGWEFPGRNRRPPTDPVNALLSLGYTLLTQRVEAMVCALGLDPAIGALHQIRGARASLACDLVEPFRVAAVDRPMLAALGRKQLQPGDFLPPRPRDGAVYLQQPALKRWLSILEETFFDGEISLNQKIAERVQKFRDDLPTLPTKPGAVPPEIATATDADPQENFPLDP